MLFAKDSNLCPNPTFMLLTLLHVEKKTKQNKTKQKLEKKRLRLLASI